MNRKVAVYTIDQPTSFKQQMLYWANRYNICCLLDNHQYPSPYSNLDCLLAVDAVSYCLPSTKRLAALRSYLQDTNDWIFGQISYDLKNEIAGLQSNHPDGIGFPVLYFFQPAIVLQLNADQLTISSLTDHPDTIFSSIQKMEPASNPGQSMQYPEALSIRARISKEDYILSVNKIKQHILQGDCYELNFCQEFYATHTIPDPVLLYHQLTQISPNPFACYYKWNNRYLLCASPERYIRKKGDQIISQPIKGTVKRDTEDPVHDSQLKKALQESEKDKAENVMVVDLVRNDLSRICAQGSVRVDELFGVYSFPQVYQMISTISGRLKPNLDLCDVLAASFPMGSMTGAPKLKVMQLIERYEQSRRGLYAGAVGYINPEKDFDFNVVIRSILYNQNTKYLSYQVGGGITFNSDAEKEYEECLVKAAAINQVLTQTETKKHSF